MSTVIVRYQVLPDRLAEHEALVRAVFTELAERRPAGVDYRAMRLEDGVSFVHVATIDTPDGSNPLQQLASFRAFTADIRSRCAVPPAASACTTAGAYAARPTVEASG